jgi:hypothetical protein
VIGLYQFVDKRFHPGDIYWGASDERQRGNLRVACLCSYSDDKARTSSLFVHGYLLTLNVCEG